MAELKKASSRFLLSLFALVHTVLVCCLTDAISVRIDVHPLKRGFNPGDNVTLTCLVVHGGPADVILWYKDDQPISANSYSNSSQMAEISLLNVTRSDAARYKCTAWKKQVKYTDSIDLHMNAAPTLKPLKEIMGALRKEDKEITCEADGWPPPLIKWKRDKVEIKDGVEYSIKAHPMQNQATLIIRSFDNDHQGDYTCEASSAFGKTSQTVSLFTLDNVQNISTNLETVRAAANTQVQLKCITSYSNFLEAEMFWTFQDEKLNETDSRYKTETYKLNSSELTREEQMSLWITNISDPDFGCYSCALNSSMGLSSATIVLAQMKSEKGYSSEGTEESDSTVLIILFPVLAGGLLLTLTAVVFIRKLLKKRHEWKPEEAASDEEIKYDVFVTFSSKDSQWVTSNLTPLLERNRLKYCIHSRDFELGRALVDNMAESVYSSRKVLAVMSKNYMDSKFCRGELDMALHRSRGVHKGSLLIVRIDGIKKKKLPKALREQIFVDYHSDKVRTVWEKKLLRYLVETEVDQNRYVTNL